MPLDPYLIQGPALISFSGGRTSGYMLKHILDAHGGRLPDNVHVVFANTGREMPETLDFVQECSDRWNVRIAWLEYDPDAVHKTLIVSYSSASRNGEPFERLMLDRNMLPNPILRLCTAELKIKRIHAYGKKVLGWPRWTEVIGLRADEPRRVAKMRRRNAEGKVVQIAACPLADAGVTKRDVGAWWTEQPFGLRLPSVNGTTPDGNCDLCFLKARQTVRSIIRRRPDLARWWIRWERWSVASGRMRNPAMAQFNADWSYATLLDEAQRQGDLLDDIADGGSLDCACTD